MADLILTLSCTDRVGIVHAVAGMLATSGCNIRDSQQFGDQEAGRFFMRVHLDSAGVTLPELRSLFEPVGARFDMQWNLFDTATRCRVLVLVSQLGHCLNDLLYRAQIGALNTEIVGVVSNHEIFAGLAEAYGTPFHHLPVTPAAKPRQEAALMRLVSEQQVDLLVLARYMQVLSDDVCARLPGRIINIHHSFLPSFKGARPHRQAFERGVKLIGATAHYVTEDLDEGPIIDQEVARVDHSYSPERLAAVGRDVEALALARAVGWHAEHRILLNASKTVVFR
jgi:formyltetrahydrofolate deformylase